MLNLAENYQSGILSYIKPQITPPSPLKYPPLAVACFSGVFSWRILLHHVENTPLKPAD
jgi:hypothetical protein